MASDKTKKKIFIVSILSPILKSLDNVDKTPNYPYKINCLITATDSDQIRRIHPINPHIHPVIRDYTVQSDQSACHLLGPIEMRLVKSRRARLL